MDSAPQNPGLKFKENMSMKLLSIPPVQANVPRTQGQAVSITSRLLNPGQCARNQG